MAIHHCRGHVTADHDRGIGPQPNAACQHHLSQQRPGQPRAQRTRWQQRLARPVIMGQQVQVIGHQPGAAQARIQRTRVPAGHRTRRLPLMHDVPHPGNGPGQRPSRDRQHVLRSASPIPPDAAEEQDPARASRSGLGAPGRDPAPSRRDHLHAAAEQDDATLGTGYGRSPVLSSRVRLLARDAEPDCTASPGPADHPTGRGQRHDEEQTGPLPGRCRQITAPFLAARILDLPPNAAARRVLEPDDELPASPAAAAMHDRVRAQLAEQMHDGLLRVASTQKRPHRGPHLPDLIRGTRESPLPQPASRCTPRCQAR
jgi:hypothetical protein